MEIPNIDILGTFKKQKHKRLQNYLSMYVSNCPVDCLNEFRQKMTIKLKKEHLDKNVSILQYRMWNNQVEKDLKLLYQPDGVHLNANGYYRLYSVLANIIYNKLKDVTGNKKVPITNRSIEKTHSEENWKMVAL